MVDINAYSEEYEIIFELETRLRLFIENELSKLSDFWWEDYVPPKVKENAEKKLEKISLPRLHLFRKRNLKYLYCCGLWDYRDIITDNFNWNKVFRHIFVDNTLFDPSPWKQLVDIRNAVMHALPTLEENDLEYLHHWSKEIFKKMDGWKSINEIYAKRSFYEKVAGNSIGAIEILHKGLEKTKTDRTPCGDPWLAYCLGNDYRDSEKIMEAEKWYMYAARARMLYLAGEILTLGHSWHFPRRGEPFSTILMSIFTSFSKLCLNL